MKQTPTNEKLCVLFACGFALILAIEYILTYGNACCSTSRSLITAHYFRPYVTELMVKSLPLLIGEDAVNIFGKIVLPSVNFYLALRVFLLFLKFRWSLAFGAIGVASIEGYPVRRFLSDLVHSREIIIQPGDLIVANFPLPGFSVFFCLLVFLVCFSSGYIDYLKASLITLVVSSLIYVHALDAAFMVLFWFCFLLTKISRQFKFQLKPVVVFFLSQIFLAVLILAPAFMLLESNAFSEANSSFSARYAFTYMCLPLILLMLAFVMRKVDPWEILIKFSPVLIAMSLELAFIVLDIMGVLRINFDYLGLGVSQVLLHQLYYVPAIYYLARDPLRIQKRLDTIAPSSQFLNIGNSTINIFQKTLLPCLIFLLVVYLLSPLRNSF